MKITHLLVGVLALGSCSRNAGPTGDTLLGPQLGESTASPGADPTRPSPLTPNDPRAMNYSASITPAQQERATQQPRQTQAPAAATPAAGTPGPTPPAPAAAPTPAPSTPPTSTSSTPVTPPTDIAPPSTTTDANRPGVFSPPPPPPGERGQ